MRVLIFPDLYEPESAWHGVSAALTEAGVQNEIATYEAPRDEDLFEVVSELNNLLVDKSYVIASGVGGRVAIQLASQRPHHLAGVMLLATPAVPAPNMRTLITKIIRIVFTPIRILIPFKLRKKVVAKYREIKPGDPRNTLRNIIIAPSMETFFPKIKVPFTLLWGKRAKKVPVEVAEAISALLEDAADIQLVAGAKDNLHLMHPKVVAYTALTAMEKLP